MIALRSWRQEGEKSSEKEPEDVLTKIPDAPPHIVLEDTRKETRHSLGTFTHLLDYQWRKEEWEK